MTRAEISSGEKARSHPEDWCVDEPWVAWQLFKALGDFRKERAVGEAIWDPCCGSGRTMVTFAEAGFPVFLSDIVNRVDRSLFAVDLVPGFGPSDFRERRAAPAPCSIVCNPPYSYIDGIAEAFVRHALRLSSRRVCMVLPLKWLGSQGRFRLFGEDHPPLAVLVLSQRPSMPPGDMIPALEAEGMAFKGGLVDYAWFVWDVRRQTPIHETRLMWLPPLNRPELQLPIEGLA